MVKEISVDEVLLRNLVNGKEGALEQLRSILSEQYIIDKDVVHRAYDGNCGAISEVQEIFRKSDKTFIYFLYNLYTVNEEAFLKQKGESNEEIIKKILRKYECMQRYVTSKQVKEMLEGKTLDGVYDLNNRPRSSNKYSWLYHYITDKYYDKKIIEIVIEILREAEEERVSNEDIENFIELRAFNVNSYFVFRHFGKLGKKVIIMYFNENKFFENIFDIAAYAAKMSYPCELDFSEISISALNFNTRLNNLLTENCIYKISDLREVINQDRLLRLEGIGLTNARTIVNTLAEFYFKNCEF